MDPEGIASLGVVTPLLAWTPGAVLGAEVLDDLSEWLTLLVLELVLAMG